MPKKIRRVTKTAIRKSKYNPMESPVIQLGIVFFFVAVIALFAYVFKNFTP